MDQAVEINGPIGFGDGPVFPGDVILGDAEGVVVIPRTSRTNSPTSAPR